MVNMTKFPATSLPDIIYLTRYLRIVLPPKENSLSKKQRMLLGKGRMIPLYFLRILHAAPEQFSTAPP